MLKNTPPCELILQACRLDSPRADKGEGDLLTTAVSAGTSKKERDTLVGHGPTSLRINKTDRQIAGTLD